MQDVWMGLIKPFVLGFVIVTIACHVGLRTTGGTQGVGKATTVAVVAGSVGGDRRGFLRHARPDLAAVLTDCSSAWRQPDVAGITADADGAGVLERATRRSSSSTTCRWRSTRR